MAKKEIKKTDQKNLIAVKDMTAEELTTKAKQLALDIQKKRLEKAVGRLKNLREIFILRKELARVKTVLRLKS